MSSLVSLIQNIDGAGKPTLRKPCEHLTISGDPEFRTWINDLSFGGKVRTGIWEATPGQFRNDMDGIYEYCFILSGMVEISEDDGETRIYRAGDSFVMKPGFRGTWNTIETVRKMFISVEGE